MLFNYVLLFNALFLLTRDKIHTIANQKQIIHKIVVKYFNIVLNSLSTFINEQKREVSLYI
jgi:hypothetical protein